MQSASVSSGNGGADGFTSNMPSGMLIAYNHGGSASGTTSSAISNGTLDIRDPGQQKQDVATLSRDVEHANGSISPIFDKEKEQKRLREVQLIGEIGTQVTDIVRTEGQLKADQEASKELEEKGIRRPGKNASKEEVENYQKQLIATDAYKQVMGKYGTGGLPASSSSGDRCLARVSRWRYRLCSGWRLGAVPGAVDQENHG